MREEEQLIELLRERNWTVTTVESCTGGAISARIVDIPGASDVLREAFVTYCDEAKHSLAGVSLETLKEYTAVSSQTAEEMALGEPGQTWRFPPQALPVQEERKGSRPVWYILRALYMARQSPENSFFPETEMKSAVRRCGRR